MHQFDEVYKAIGEYKVPELTDVLMQEVAGYLMTLQKNFIVVRPSRDYTSVSGVKWAAISHEYTFLPVRLTASYATLCTRVTRRACGNESPYRLTTKESLDEYLGARPESEFPGEHVIDTDQLTPEQVAGRIKELLPCQG